jgi:hypothetical protein
MSAALTILVAIVSGLGGVYLSTIGSARRRIETVA